MKQKIFLSVVIDFKTATACHLEKLQGHIPQMGTVLIYRHTNLTKGPAGNSVLSTGSCFGNCPSILQA